MNIEIICETVGNIKSELYRHVWRIQHLILVGLTLPLIRTTHSSLFIQDFLTLYPTPIGALTQLYVGTMPEALQHNGEVRRDEY